MTGANASPKPYKFTSAFHCMDALVQRLCNRSAFPGLVRVVLTGYSAGAQMLNRYAWASPVGYPVGKVRYIFSDASSYLYFDSKRPNPSCCALIDTGPEVQCASFHNVSTESAAECPGYDSWKYGITVLPITGYAYLERFLGNYSVTICFEHVNMPYTSDVHVLWLYRQ